MSKKSSITKTKKQLNLFLKFKNKFNFLKQKLIIETNFNKKLHLLQQIQKLPLNSTKTRQHKRCWLTGRSKSIYSCFELSKNKLVEFASLGFLPGIIKI